MDNTVGSLTQFQKSVIKGIILGDGYLRKLEGRSNAFLEINHSYRQKSYVDWKYQQLKNICLSSPKKRFCQSVQRLKELIAEYFIDDMKYKIK